MSVTSDRDRETLTRNERYVQNMSKKGLKKVTLWVPEIYIEEFRLMASVCCDDKDYYPSLVRSKSKGTVKSINQ